MRLDFAACSTYVEALDRAPYKDVSVAWLPRDQEMTSY